MERVKNIKLEYQYLPTDKAVTIAEYADFLFPEIQNSRISGLLSQFIIVLEPICLPEIVNNEGTKDNSFAFIRGSTVKRWQYKTPVGFWEISQKFAAYVPKPTETPRSLDLIKKMAEGPRDIDIRYQLLADFNTENLVSAVKIVLEKENFKENKGNYKANIEGKEYEVILIRKKLGGDRGPAREFLTVACCLNGKVVLNIDFGEKANEEQKHDEFRLSSLFSTFEQSNIACIVKKGDTAIVLPPEKSQTLSENTIAGVDSPIEDCIVYQYAMLRAFNNFLFYPGISDDSHPIDQNYISVVWQTINKKHLPDFLCVIYNQSSPDGKRFFRRRSDFWQQMMLGLMSDPVNFLTLLYDSAITEGLPLGAYLRDEDDLLYITDYIENELGEKGDYGELQEIYLRQRLCNHQAGLIDCGPFMVLRAVKKLRNVHLPEDMERVMYLTDLVRRPY